MIANRLTGASFKPAEDRRPRVSAHPSSVVTGTLAVQPPRLPPCASEVATFCGREATREVIGLPARVPGGLRTAAEWQAGKPARTLAARGPDSRKSTMTESDDSGPSGCSIVQKVTILGDSRLPRLPWLPNDRPARPRFRAKVTKVTNRAREAQKQAYLQAGIHLPGPIPPS